MGPGTSAPLERAAAAGPHSKRSDARPPRTAAATPTAANVRGPHRRSDGPRARDSASTAPPQHAPHPARAPFASVTSRGGRASRSAYGARYVCTTRARGGRRAPFEAERRPPPADRRRDPDRRERSWAEQALRRPPRSRLGFDGTAQHAPHPARAPFRSEEHTSELQ